MIYLSRKHNPKYSSFLLRGYKEIREFFGGEESKGAYPICAGINYPKEACEKAKYDCSMKKGLHWDDGGKECYNDTVLEITGVVPQETPQTTETKTTKLSKEALIGIGIGTVSLLVIMGVIIKRNI